MFDAKAYVRKWCGVPGSFLRCWVVRRDAGGNRWRETSCSQVESDCPGWSDELTEWWMRWQDCVGGGKRARLVEGRKMIWCGVMPVFRSGVELWSDHLSPLRWLVLTKFLHFPVGTGTFSRGTDIVISQTWLKMEVKVGRSSRLHSCFWEWVLGI